MRFKFPFFFQNMGVKCALKSCQHFCFGWNCPSRCENIACFHILCFLKRTWLKALHRVLFLQLACGISVTRSTLVCNVIAWLCTSGLLFWFFSDETRAKIVLTFNTAASKTTTHQTCVLFYFPLYYMLFMELHGTPFLLLCSRWRRDWFWVTGKKKWQVLDMFDCVFELQRFYDVSAWSSHIFIEVLWMRTVISRLLSNKHGIASLFC